MRPSSAHPSSLRAQVQDVREERSMPSISPAPERERPGTAAPAASEKGGGGRVPIRHRIRKATAAAKSLYPNSYGWERNGVDLSNRNQTREVERLKMEAQHWKDQLEQLRVPFALYGPSDWTSNSSYPKIARATKELEDLREELKQLEHSIAEYCTETEGLRINVSEQQTHIFNLRKKRKNINFTRDSHLLTQKQIHVVENRLDTALVQFNAVLKDNKELRERIDTYRRERDVFDGIYQRLEGELQEKKREMAFIIEVSNIAYEERDAAMQELAQLRTFAHDEVGSFKETFKALDQLLEEDRKMKETVRNRITERERKERELKQELARVEKMNTNNSVILANAAPHSSASAGGGPSHSNNNNNNNNTPSAASGAGLDLSNLPPRSDVQTIRMYEEAVAKITSATEVPDLSQLMHRFVHSEDSNFSLFNYANELHQEVEVLEAQQVALQEEIAALLDGGDEEQSRRAQLSGYEEALRAAEGRSVRYEQAMRHTENLLHDTMTLIQSLFELLHCDEAIIAKTHGVVELSTETVLEYLAAIEMHVELYLATPSSTSGNGLSERHGGGSSQDALVSWEPAGGAGAAASTSQGGGPLMPYDASLLDIDPRRLPNTGDDGDVSEEEDRIWTHEEMLRRAREKMMRQQQQQQQQQHNNNTGGAGTGVGRSRRKKPLGGGGHGGMNSGELGGSLRR